MKKNPIITSRDDILSFAILCTEKNKEVQKKNNENVI